MIKNILIVLLLSNALFALNLGTLLSEIKKDSSQEIIDEQKRLDEFIQNKKNQALILKQTKQALKKEEQRTKYLQNKIEENENILAKKEKELSIKVAKLGEMFGSVRQTSSDFLNNYKNSLDASQKSNKDELFTQLSQSKALPNMKKLENFWYAMLDEILQSGNIAQYESDVINAQGEKNKQIITRVGLFAAVSNGKYLEYSNDMKTLVELSVQPKNRVLNEAKEFEHSNDGLKNIVIDPTRGTLLDMIKNNPTVLDRINQGGAVGYIILTLGSMGLLFAFYKMIILNLIQTSIKKQLKDISNISLNNPLGRIATIFNKNKDKAIEELEIKMTQSILKETNSVKKGQSFVKLLAAVTPLLGLLGTVTGMIATFQAITLFGTGDPKLMAGGISTALITTVLGLVTAIPLLFSYTYISSKSENIVSILEEQSVGLLAQNLK